MSDTAHRTYGETRDCKGCRYWSEMLAMYNAEVQGAACLTPNRKSGFGYTPHWHTCDSWKSGHYGAVDEPCERGYGVDAMEAYEAEEKQPEPSP